MAAGRARAGRQRPDTWRTHRGLRHLPRRLRKLDESRRRGNLQCSSQRPGLRDGNRPAEGRVRRTQERVRGEHVLFLLGRVQTKVRPHACRIRPPEHAGAIACASRRSTERTAMINRIIDFSVENKLVVFALLLAACVAGWWSMQRVALDAIPDLSDTQVIIYSRWERSPDIIEDQVTYPIVSAMLGAPKVKTVRGFSDFGYSYVYVIFEDGTDIYWARSRTLEYLSGVLPRLPQGVSTEMGPDATGLGWVYQYALMDTSGQHTLAEMRSYEDWYLRYHLKAVPGVAEVAPLGGFRQQYQVNVDPNRLQAYGIPISRVVEAVRAGNNDVGGRLLELGGTEYMVRGRGYARSIHDFEDIVLVASESGTPIRVKDVGQVVLGPDLRRGVS